MAKGTRVRMDSSGIIFGAKSIISGMFRKNEEDTEIDDSYFMPMLKTCIHTTGENLRQAGSTRIRDNSSSRCVVPALP